MIRNYWIAYKHKKSGMWLHPAKLRMDDGKYVKDRDKERLIAMGYSEGQAERLSDYLSEDMTNLDIKDPNKPEKDIKAIAGNYPIMDYIDLSEFEAHDHTSWFRSDEDDDDEEDE